MITFYVIISITMKTRIPKIRLANLLYFARVTLVVSDPVIIKYLIYDLLPYIIPYKVVI